MPACKPFTPRRWRSRILYYIHNFLSIRETERVEAHGSHRVGRVPRRVDGQLQYNEAQTEALKQLVTEDRSARNLHSYGLCSYGLSTYGLYSYGI